MLKDAFSLVVFPPRWGRDLAPPPWPHPSWLNARPHPKVGSARQKGKRVCPPASETGGRSPAEDRSRSDDLVIEEDEDIVEFFGQLWAIDSPPRPVKPRVLSSSKSTPNLGNLFWIRRELVERKSFSPADCFPVGRFDRIEKQPVRIGFGEIWSREEERKTYAQALKGSMAEEGRWVWQPEPRRPPPLRLQRPIQQNQARYPPPQQQQHQARYPPQQLQQPEGWQDRGPRAPRSPPPPVRRQQLPRQQPPPRQPPARQQQPSQFRKGSQQGNFRYWIH